MACSLTLPDHESTGELESADAELNPADAEPRLQPQNRCGTASSRGSHVWVFRHYQTYAALGYSQVLGWRVSWATSCTTSSMRRRGPCFWN